MTDREPQKKRPLVDPSVFELARAWITENYAIEAETADAAGAALEDVVWDFADAIQHEMETWLGYEEGRRLRLLRGCDD